MRGFTLLEMIIVVAIVALLGTIVLPGFIRSRTRAIESSALSNLKTLSGACRLYQISENIYPEDLAALSNSTPPYIDSQLGAGQKQRYEFVYARVDSDSFTLNANPMDTGLWQGRFFYTDESGIIRVKNGEAAGADDEIVG